MPKCRICLSPSPDKYLNQLKTSKKDGSKNHSEILLFCLDIQISDGSETKEKVCSKCLTKTLSFFTFKLMALKNDAFLKSVDTSQPKPSSSQNSLVSLVDLDESGQAVVPSDDTDDDDASVSLNNEFGETHYVFEIDENIQYEDVQYIEEEYDLDVNLEPNVTDTNKDEHFPDPTLKNKRKPEVFVFTNKKAKGKKSNTSKKDSTTTIVSKKARPKAKPKAKPKPGVCDHCGESVKDVKNHSLVHLPKDERQKFPCTNCSKTFFTTGALRWHNRMTHLGELGHCEICNKDYKELRAHKLAMHNREELRYECGVCKTRFLSSTKLDAHMTQHTKEHPFQCETCGKKFVQKIVLDTHVRSVHNKERNFTCKFCPKSFFQKYHLDCHTRIHTKERPYRCNECGKFFAQTSILRNHMMTHSSVRVYPCKLCDMTFKAKSTLYFHKKTHSEEREQPRPFQCPHCDMRYKRLVDMQRHVHRHTQAQGVLKKHQKSSHKLRKLVVATD